MADSDSGYQVGPGRPPLHTRFKKGQSGNPGGRSAKTLRRCSPRHSTRRSTSPRTGGAARAASAGRGGQGGGATLRSAVALADTAGNRGRKDDRVARIAPQDRSG